LPLRLPRLAYVIDAKVAIPNAEFRPSRTPHSDVLRREMLIEGSFRLVGPKAGARRLPVAAFGTRGHSDERDIVAGIKGLGRGGFRRMAGRDG